MISGPIPAGSPMVMPIGRCVMNMIPLRPLPT
jgi:hypothetical protein